MRRDLLLVAFAAALLAACSDAPQPLEPGLDPELSASIAGDDGPGAVYLMSNAAGDNEVLVFDRSADGQLTAAGAYSTGGAGSGGGLGNQASIALTHDLRRLYVVNAGSDDISAFEVMKDGLQLIGTPVPSGGQQPISLTVHGNLLYVLNAGGTGNISGFRIGTEGGLDPLSGSTQPLSSDAAGPAQIQFSPDGRVLVVTEKATNTITTYMLGRDRRPGPPTAHASAGETPFGFNFNGRGNLIVSEAFGGAPGASTASSYSLQSDGSLMLVTGPVATTQTAACWIAISQNGRYAYTTNTGSGTISSLVVGSGGTLTLLDAVAGVTGPGSLPQDAAFTPGGRYLYVRNAGGSIGAFRVDGNGDLTHIGDFGPISAAANGLAAR